MKNKPAFAADPVAVSLDPDRRTSMEDVLNTVNINDVFLSPDGRRVAVALSQRPRGGSESSRWLEILDTENGSRVFTSQGLGRYRQFPVARKFAPFFLHPRRKGSHRSVRL